MDIGGFGDKAKDFLNSEQGEERSDQVLDKVADFADERTGGKHADKIERGRDFVDDRIGVKETPPADR